MIANKGMGGTECEKQHSLCLCFKNKKSTKGVRDSEILRTSDWQVWTVAKNEAGREHSGYVCCGEEESAQTSQRVDLPSQLCKAESMSV